MSSCTAYPHNCPIKTLNTVQYANLVSPSWSHVLASRLTSSSLVSSIHHVPSVRQFLRVAVGRRCLAITGSLFMDLIQSCSIICTILNSSCRRLPPTNLNWSTEIIVTNCCHKSILWWRCLSRSDRFNYEPGTYCNVAWGQKKSVAGVVSV